MGELRECEDTCLAPCLPLLQCENCVDRSPLESALDLLNLYKLR